MLLRANAIGTLCLSSLVFSGLDVFAQSSTGTQPPRKQPGRYSAPTRPGDVPAAAKATPVESVAVVATAVTAPPAAEIHPDPASPAPLKKGDPLPSATAWLEAQIALSREGFSCGPIDGVPGAQTRAALQAFQGRENLPVTGQLDAATRDVLVLDSPPLTEVVVTEEDLARLQPLSPTWLGKSQQTRLDYTTVLELVAERSRASHTLVRRLNPGVDWERVVAGTVVKVPSIPKVTIKEQVAHLHVRLAERTLTARAETGRVLVHFPVSIAREVAKRPVGELRVTVVVPNPDYTFNPEVFVESEEGRELGRKLILPPGPNNPVGIAWIGLDRPGYGIHGTPSPEQVGRTESHGCFRLANWDAETLLRLAWVGLPVLIEP